MLQSPKGITVDCHGHCLVEYVFSLPLGCSVLILSYFSALRSFKPVIYLGLVVCMGLRTTTKELCVTGVDSLVQFVRAPIITTLSCGDI